ncbi:ATP-binding cassette domain-containing protein [Streptomyces sp. NPDC091376]|uniref:ATP-binding cassette domain-containing protein n=1 Tax=Streptomyces sp. NPDC091376 TaxID=3365994 RepID=UPI0037FC8764
MDSPHGAAVRAEGFGLKGPRGWAFQGVDVQAGPGSLIAIEGPSGSGRTCLLLALTGRMKPSVGRAEVGGLPLPRKMAAVRRISALGPVPGVSDLDPALTVTEHLRERALLQRRFDGSLRALLRPRGERAESARSRIAEALDTAGLDVDALPKAGRTAVRDLERLEALRLSVALALIGRPRLLAVDDTDLKLSDTDRALAWELLRDVAARGTTVLAVCSEAPQDAVLIRTVTTAAGEAQPGPVPDPERAEPEPADATDTPADSEPAKSAPDADRPADSTPGPDRPDDATDTPADTEPAKSAADADRPADSTPGPDRPDDATDTPAETEPAKSAADAGPGRPEAGADGAQHHTDDTEEGAADAFAETGRA